MADMPTWANIGREAAMAYQPMGLMNLAPGNPYYKPNPWAVAAESFMQSMGNAGRQAERRDDIAERRAMQQQMMDMRQQGVDLQRQQFDAQQARAYDQQQAQRANAAMLGGLMAGNAGMPNLAAGAVSGQVTDNWARGQGGGPDMSRVTPDAMVQAWKMQQPKSPSGKVGQWVEYQRLTGKTIPFEEFAAMESPGTTQTVNVNPGREGVKVLEYDSKKGIAAVADPSSPNGIRIVKLPGGEAAEETEARGKMRGVTSSTAVREIDYLLGGLGYDPETGKQTGESRVAGPRERQIVGTSIGKMIYGGTPSINWVNTLQSIKDTVAIDRLLQIKAAGSGLGQVPQSQLEALARALGNLDSSNDDTLLARNLKDVRDIYTNIMETSIQDANDDTFTGVVSGVAYKNAGNVSDGDSQGRRPLNAFEVR